jgi:membrane protein implicated in regulation of membrane protease activity
MIWWYWILFGLGLAALEIATPGGFFFAFFALAALAIGLLELAGILEADALQWALFSVLSVACMVFFRKPLFQWMNRAQQGEAVDSLVGELAVPATAISAGEHGRAELRGAMWNVRNVDNAGLASGERCRVIAVRGLELDIRSERSR